MERIALALAAIFTLAGAVAQTPRHLDPAMVAVGKELPRGEVVSHDSKADAVRQTGGASKYLQPLDEWTSIETADAVRWRTSFKIPFEWIDRQQFLYVGRASGSFDVMVNGELVAYSQTGSTPSEFDITKAAKDGANELEIVIYKDPVTRLLESGRQPVAPRIEGEVYVLSQPRERVRDVAISTRMEGSNGLLQLGVILKSHRINPHDYTVYWELLNPLGEIVAEGKKDARLEARREDTVTFFANIPRIVPWSHEDPRLYTLFIKTQNEGRFREYLSFRVGFRSLDSGDDGGLYLNGVPLGLVMREFSPTGDVGTMRTAIGQLRGQGVNTIMLRGAPPRREFYALCDSMGVYVACMADIDTHLSGESRRVGGNPSNDPVWGGAYLDRVMAMYHTSKNHPSVTMFSLAGNSANGINLYESYLALKALEPHRPVLYSGGGGEWNTDLLSDAAPAAASVAPKEWLTLEAVDVSKWQLSPSTVEPASDQSASVDEPRIFDARFRVGNSRQITPFVGEAVYRIVAGRRNVLASGAVPVEVMPGGTTEFTIPITGVKEGKPYTLVVELAAERTDGDYIPAGDPNLKVFRRLDQPLNPQARTVILNAEFKSDE